MTDAEWDRMLQTVRDTVAENTEAIDLIAEFVTQDCTAEFDVLDSMGISTYAEALRYLARQGRVEITKEHGRRVFARWKYPALIPAVTPPA